MDGINTKATVLKVYPVQTINGKKGEFQKMRFIGETVNRVGWKEKYPFELVGQYLDKHKDKIKVGAELDVYFNIKSYYYKEKDIYYLNLEVWNVKELPNVNQQPIEQAPDLPPELPPQDDLSF